MPSCNVPPRLSLDRKRISTRQSVSHGTKGQEDQWSRESQTSRTRQEQEREQGTSHQHHQWNRSSVANQTRLFRGFSANIGPHNVENVSGSPAVDNQWYQGLSTTRDSILIPNTQLTTQIDHQETTPTQPYTKKERERTTSQTENKKQNHKVGGKHPYKSMSLK